MPRVEMWENMYDDVITDRGHDVKWERAVVCRCVSEDSGQPDYMCPICGGSGYRYMKPKDIRVLVTSINSKLELEVPNLREPGTAYVTCRDDTIMGYHDRLKFPNFKCMFSEVLRFSESEYGRGISSKTYRDIRGVVFLADDQYEYEQGVDFEITEDEFHIRWLNKDYIDELDGKTLSMLYYTTPSYIITDILHELRATMSMRKTPTEKFVELPKQYLVKREDFVYNVAEPEPVKKTEDTAVDDDLDETDPINVDEDLDDEVDDTFSTTPIKPAEQVSGVDDNLSNETTSNTTAAKSTTSKSKYNRNRSTSSVFISE